jgi:predicted alpha/beta superfamily hydrolase
MARSGSYRIENTEKHEIYSPVIDQEFVINVGLPPGYTADGDRYPVVYVTDGGSIFGSLMSSIPLMQMVGDLPPFVLVGIDYKSEHSRDSMSLRNRDLTPTNDEGWMASQKERGQLFENLPVVEPGGAANFLDFLNLEVKGKINELYHIDPDDQTYGGFSLGGLFGLYTLFTAPASFNRYVVGSPSIWWDDSFILKVEEEYAKSNRSLNARVFLSIGDLEEADEADADFRMVTNVRLLDEIFAKRAYEGLRLKTVVFEDETHCSAVAGTMNRGLRSVFSD